jgi:hypothetical protein
MSDRERFHAAMCCQPHDRSPICDLGHWDEALVTWHERGDVPLDDHAFYLETVRRV